MAHPIFYMLLVTIGRNAFDHVVWFRLACADGKTGHQSQVGSVGSADRLNGEGEIPRFGRGWASLSENPDPVIAMARRPALEP